MTSETAGRLLRGSIALGALATAAVVLASPAAGHVRVRDALPLAGWALVPFALMWIVARVAGEGAIRRVALAVGFAAVWATALSAYAESLYAPVEGGAALGLLLFPTSVCGAVVVVGALVLGASALRRHARRRYPPDAA
ncbi:MAG TPA: hypothetical protein VHG91_04775 [Longimicrobium sp.]|nr:hypothetical protein [Longimicrobium sp.]